MNPVMSTENDQGRQSPATDTVGRRIKARLEELGISEREAGRRAGFGLSYVGDVIHGRSKEPSAERLLKLAEVLGCDLDYLISGGAPARSDGAVRQFAPPATKAPGRMLALYTSLSISADIWSAVEPEPVDKVPVIPPLTHVDSAYAWSIASSHMEPRYFPGEVVYLHPGLTPRVGDFVLAKKIDGTASVARLEAQTRESVRLAYLKCAEPQDVLRSDLESVHRVIASSG